MPRNRELTKPLHVEPGTLTRQYTPQEVTRALGRWLAVFGRHAQGARADKYLWHIFSSGCYPSQAGQAAKASYEKQVAHEYVVLSNDRQLAFSTDLRPESCTLTDYCVFPPNLAWTMAFTHEDGWLGPYFARHPDFEALNQENAARVRKEREAAAARLRGWG